MRPSCPLVTAARLADERPSCPPRHRRAPSLRAAAVPPSSPPPPPPSRHGGRCGAAREVCTPSYPKGKKWALDWRVSWAARGRRASHGGCGYSSARSRRFSTPDAHAPHLSRHVRQFRAITSARAAPPYHLEARGRRRRVPGEEALAPRHARHARPAPFSRAVGRRAKRRQAPARQQQVSRPTVARRGAMRAEAKAVQQLGRKRRRVRKSPQSQCRSEVFRVLGGSGVRNVKATRATRNTQGPVCAWREYRILLTPAALNDDGELNTHPRQ